MPFNERSTLTKLADRLIAESRRELFHVPRWVADVPTSPGVYVLSQRTSDCPVYVGETTNLRARMKDLGRYENHTCRRKLAKQLRIERGDEAILSTAIARTHTLSYLEVRLGRAELEEYLRVRWSKSLLNAPGRRHRVLYDWVDPEDCQVSHRTRGKR